MVSDSIQQFPADGAFKRRSTTLSVLCVISFIISGWTFIGCVMSVFTSKEKLRAEVEAGMNQVSIEIENLPPDQSQMIESFIISFFDILERAVEINVSYNLTYLFILGLSLYGVWLMWKGRRRGFWNYFLAKGLLVALPLVFFGVSGFTLGWVVLVVLISGIMSLLYYSQKQYFAN